MRKEKPIGTAERPIEEVEGVVKYQLFFDESVLSVEAEQVADLNHARDLMVSTRLIGCDPDRYSGLGFGNLSTRSSSRNDFIISATQTGHLQHLSRSDVSLVTRSCPTQNKLWARGQSQPSSEAMTHAIIYESRPEVQAVVHVHSPDIWYHGARLNLRSTDVSVPYGTPQMASAVKALVKGEEALERASVFVMEGHQDGVVAYGISLEACTDCLLAMLNKARSIEPQK